jgi:hypothetical protein
MNLDGDKLYMKIVAFIKGNISGGNQACGANYGNSHLDRQISILRPRIEPLQLCKEPPASPLIRTYFFAIKPPPLSHQAPNRHEGNEEFFSKKKENESSPPLAPVSSLPLAPVSSSSGSVPPVGIHALRRPPLAAEASRPDAGV